MSTVTDTTPEMGEVAIAEIVVAEGFNHRTVINEESFNQLVDSVKQHGVLQPILVRVNTDNIYEVVDGHRRFAAARAAKLSTINVIVTPAKEGDDVTAISVVANLIREDVAPVDQARAFKRLLGHKDSNTQKKLAKLLNISEATISSRLRLLALPESTQSLINDGGLPMRVAPLLATIAEKSPLLAEAISAYICNHENDGSIDDFLNDPSGIVYEILHNRYELLSPDAFVWGVNRWNDFQSIVTTDKRLAGLAEFAPDFPNNWEPRAWPQFTDDLIAQARQFGALLELPNDWNKQLTKFIIDADWLVANYFEIAEKKAKSNRKATVKAEKAAGKDEAPEAKLDAKQKKAKEREEKIKLEREAFFFNTSLGIALKKKYADDAKLTVDQARLIAFNVLTKLDPMAGIAHTHDDWHTVVNDGEEKGRLKVEFPDSADAKKRLCDWVLAGKTTEAVLNRLTQAMIAGIDRNESAPKAQGYSGVTDTAYFLSKKGKEIMDKSMAKIQAVVPAGGKVKAKAATATAKKKD